MTDLSAPPLTRIPASPEVPNRSPVLRLYGCEVEIQRLCSVMKPLHGVLPSDMPGTLERLQGELRAIRQALLLEAEPETLVV